MVVKMERTKIASIVVVITFVISTFGLSIINAHDTEERYAEITLSFSRPAVEGGGDYMTVSLEGIDSYRMVAGEPVMPVSSTMLTFPLGTKILGVECTPINIKTMYLEKKIEPAPKPTLLNSTLSRVVEKKEIYTSAAPYPERWCYYSTGGGINQGEHVSLLE